MFIRSIVAAALLTSTCGVALGQVQNAGQQKCINTIGKGTISISKAEWGSLAKCTKAYAKDPIENDLYDCLSLETKPIVATVKATGKAIDACVVPPDFGTFDELSPSYALGGGGYLGALLLGGDYYDGLALCDDDVLQDSACKCQGALLASAGKSLLQYLGLFNKCKKAGLKRGTIVDIASLGACMTDPNQLDPKGKLAKAETKLAGTIAKKCTMAGISDPFPGANCDQPADAAELAQCLRSQIRCTACLYTLQVDGAESDCDLFDDNVANDSCDIGCDIDCIP